jgi:hypothetical protein
MNSLTKAKRALDLACRWIQKQESVVKSLNFAFDPCYGPSPIS